MKKTLFNQWVNDNNPRDDLSYRKGWWEFIEQIRYLASRLNIDDQSISTVATFTLYTPPPEEELTSPIILLETDKYCAYIKEDFGRFWESSWIVSVIGSSPMDIPSIEVFISEMDLDTKAKEGFKAEWILPPYKTGTTGFSCMAVDKFDVYGLLRLIDTHYRSL